jgi:hypothetical protein
MRRKKKPDLMAVLVLVVGLGVLASGLAQGLWADDTQHVSPLATGKALVASVSGR